MRKAMLALLLLAGAGQASAQSVIPPEVQAVIDRSHATRTNYAVVLRIDEFIRGARHVRNYAEYQEGALHRVEVPLLRVLANCDTGESAVYNVASRSVVDRGDQRASACGIAQDGDGTIVAARLLEPVTGPYGRADVIELTGDDFVRRYVVTDDGIIVANDFTPRRPEVGFSLRTLGATVRRGHQDPAMFEEGALARAFTPPPD